MESACRFARKHRLGPYRRAVQSDSQLTGRRTARDEERRRSVKELQKMVRHGFSLHVAQVALRAAPPEDAQDKE